MQKKITQISPALLAELGCNQEPDKAKVLATFATSPRCYPRAVRGLVGEDVIVDEQSDFRYVKHGGNRFVVEARKSEQDESWEIARVWRTRKYHAWRHWVAWLMDTSELYQVPELDTNRQLNPPWSPLLGLIGALLFFLRRFSFYEIAKHTVPDISGRNRTPARYLDFYLLGFWLTAFVFAIKIAPSIGAHVGWCWFMLFVVTQVIQTSFYHEFWRTLRQTKIESEKSVYNRLRNCVIGVLNVVFVTAVFGLSYFFSGDLDLVQANSEGPTQVRSIEVEEAVYFSYTLAWSAGPVGLETRVGPVSRRIIVAQIVATLFLVGVLLAMVVSALKPLPEFGDKPNSGQIDSGERQ